jgi:hypothetical protein
MFFPAEFVGRGDMSRGGPGRLSPGVGTQGATPATPQSARLRH